MEGNIKYLGGLSIHVRSDVERIGKEVREGKEWQKGVGEEGGRGGGRRWDGGVGREKGEEEKG